jgi:integrase
VTRAFDTHVGAVKLPRLRLHDLRHSHATLGLAAGIPAKVMSERLGHSKVGITLDLYSHVMPGMQEEAAAKLGALVLGS